MVVHYLAAGILIITSLSSSYRCVSGYTYLTDPALKWPNGVVYYKFDHSISHLVPIIKRAMRRIEAKTCIRFIQRSQQQPNYVTFRLVSKEVGCFAPVGYKRNGQQEVRIYEPECGFLAYFGHMLLHQLGVVHEHQRSDRDLYIKVYTKNIDPGRVQEYNKLDPNSHARSVIYDPNSVMHYGSFRFSTNGKPTILLRNGNRITDIPDKKGPDLLDMIGVNTLYDCVL